MIKLDLKYLIALQQVQSYTGLIPFLQSALELEHTVMLPYLTAMYSIQANAMTYAQKTFSQIAKQEMLHMTIVANIINAFAGKPDLDRKTFIKNYPCELPMGVEKGMKVGLEKYTLETTHDIFMEIEEPVHAENFVSQEIESIPDYFTQSMFYQVLIQKVKELAPEDLPGNPANQVYNEQYFSSNELFPIIKKSDAIRGLNIISEQGEGSSVGPFDNNQGELAHYYRFSELFNQAALVQNAQDKLGYSYTGTPYPYEAQSVYNIFPNTKQAMFAEGSEAWQLLDQFNDTYNQLMEQLQQALNGQPSMLGNAVSQMKQLKQQAYAITSTPFPNRPQYNLGPSFEYKDIG